MALPPVSVFVYEILELFSEIHALNFVDLLEVIDRFLQQLLKEFDLLKRL